MERTFRLHTLSAARALWRAWGKVSDAHDASLGKSEWSRRELGEKWVLTTRAWGKVSGHDASFGCRRKMPTAIADFVIPKSLLLANIKLRTAAQR